MTITAPSYSSPKGIVIHFQDQASQTQTRAQMEQLLAEMQLSDAVQTQIYVNEQTEGAGYLRICLNPHAFTQWTPEFNTFHLCDTLGLDTKNNRNDLAKEIWIALLACPIDMGFPSVDELISSIRICQFIVEAARKTALDFHTIHAERPDDYWLYDEDKGFVIKPGKSLISALQKATQPDVSGTLFSFSCYRATEYVTLLALAQEAEISNPELLAQLQTQWETRAIKSGKFHEVFLRELGSVEEPMPIAYYIPGARVWFRNPDAHSSDVSGFEGSWVFYLGDGEFPNFWQRNKPFTLRSKCLEIYHWRHAAKPDENGELQMDEDLVQQLLQQTTADAEQAEAIYQRMYRLRDKHGCYDEGGCMDTSREFVRCVRPGTTDIVMPGFY